MNTEPALVLPKSSRGHCGTAGLVVAAVVLLILKLAVAYGTLGTGDMTSWIDYARTIREYGTFDIYAHIARYNHPPLVSWILAGLDQLSAASGVSLAFWLRALMVLADTASLAALWRLLPDRPKHRWILLLAILNPVNLLISSFHGNTDPLMGAMLLWAVVLCAGGHWRSGALCYALSVCVKIVPLLVLPAFVLMLKNQPGRIKARFAVVALLTLGAVYAPYLWHDSKSLVANVVLYSGNHGTWGIGLAAMECWHALLGRPGLARVAWTIYLCHLVFWTLFYAWGIFVFWRRAAAEALAKNVLGLLLFFMVISPGFGLQYLCWISFLALALLWRWGAVYVGLGGIFLYRIYAGWGALRAPFYADAAAFMHNSWNGSWTASDKWLGFALWILVCGMLAAIVRSGPQAGEGMRRS